MTANVCNRPSSAPIPSNHQYSNCAYCNNRDLTINKIFYNIFGKQVILCDQSCILKWVVQNSSQPVNGRY